MTKANYVLHRLRDLPPETLKTVLDVAIEYADCSELCGHVMPAGNRLLRQLELAMEELEVR